MRYANHCSEPVSEPSLQLTQTLAVWRCGFFNFGCQSSVLCSVILLPHDVACVLNVVRLCVRVCARLSALVSWAFPKRVVHATMDHATGSAARLCSL